MRQAIDYYITKILEIVLFLVLARLAFKLLGFQGLIYLIITASIMLGWLYLRWKRFTKKGMIRYFGEGTKKILLQRSILDIFRDLVYFPYLLKIITTIFFVITSKPHPDKIPQILKTLPNEIQTIVTKKGLLSLMPQTIERLILPGNQANILNVNYGKNEDEWDRKDQYALSYNLVHQQTLEKKIVHFIDGKFGWITVIALILGVFSGAKKMKYKNFKKMLIYNTTFYCLFLTMIALFVKIRKNYQMRKRKASKSIKTVSADDIS